MVIIDLMQWLAIDPRSGLPPLHSDITRTIRRDCEIQALSVWDREDYFWSVAS